MKKYHDELRNLLRDDKIRECLDSLNISLVKVDKDLYDSCILLSGRYVNAEKDDRNGTNINNKEEINKIRKALTDIINEIEKKDIEESSVLKINIKEKLYFFIYGLLLILFSLLLLYLGLAHEIRDNSLSIKNTIIENKSKKCLITSSSHDLYNFIKKNSKSIKILKISGINLTTTTSVLDTLVNKNKFNKEIDIETIFTKFDSVYRAGFVPYQYISNAHPRSDSASVKLKNKAESMERVKNWRTKLPFVRPPNEINFPVNEKIVYIELDNSYKVCFVELFPVLQDENYSKYIRLDNDNCPDLFKFYIENKYTRYDYLVGMKYN